MLRTWKNNWRANNRMNRFTSFPISTSTFDGLITTLNSTCSICKILKRDYDSSYLLTSALNQDNLEVRSKKKMHKHFVDLHIFFVQLCIKNTIFHTESPVDFQNFSSFFGRKSIIFKQRKRIVAPQILLQNVLLLKNRFGWKTLRI